MVEVTARDYAFDVPDEIPSGWTTFRMTNAGEQEHFLYVYRLPENKTYQEFQEEVIVPFGKVWEQYDSGEIDRTEAESGPRLGNRRLVFYRGRAQRWSRAHRAWRDLADHGPA